MRNYLFEMLDTLTSAFSRRDYNNRHKELPLETNIGKLFAILAWGLDSIQEQAELIKLWDNIDNAKGSVLDRYGANFGVKRIGPNDQYYRLVIKVKVMAQLSSGNINTVIWATASLLEVEPSDVLLKEIYPAKIALYVDQELLSQAHFEMIYELADAIKRIISTGVGMKLYLRTYRTYWYKIPISRLSIMNSHSIGLPTMQHENSKAPVLILSTGFRGVYCSTHIKSKRIN